MKPLSLPALLAAGGVALLCGTSGAQQTPVTATNLTYKGAPIASGYVTMTPMTPGNSGYQVAVTGPASGLSYGPLVGTVTNGAIAAGFAVPDQCLSTAVTANTPWGYLVQLVDTAVPVTASNPSGTVTVTWYIPPTPQVVCGNTAFALDKYTPLQTSTSVGGYSFGLAANLPTHLLPGALFTAIDTHTLYVGGSDGLPHAVTGSGGSGGVGATGQAGPPGSTPAISVAATTLAAGAQATAVVTGPAAAPLITFGIPQGQAGTNGTNGTGGGTSTLTEDTLTCNGTLAIPFPASGTRIVHLVNTTAACAVSFTNQPAAGSASEMRVIFNPTAFAVTFPAASSTLVWRGGIAPASPTNSAISAFHLTADSTRIIGND